MRYEGFTSLLRITLYRQVCNKSIGKTTKYTKTIQHNCATYTKEEDMGEIIRERLSSDRGRAREDAAFAKELCNQQEELFIYLSDEDAKTRKNAALLLGMLPWECDKKKNEVAEKLYDHYEKEPVLYVRPSFLKAIGQLGIDFSDRIQSGLRNRKSHILTHSFTDEEYKHIAEEQRMLLRLTNHNDGHEFTGIKKKVPLLLTVGKGHEKYLISDLIRNGVPQEDIRKTPFGVRVMTENISPILSNRIYDKIYFIVPIKKDSRFTFEDRKEVIENSLFIQMLDDYLSGDGCVFFRVNVLLQKEDSDLKHKLANEFARTLEGMYPERLANAPGNYEIEVFFAERKDHTFGMFLWFKEFKTNRFAYRLTKNSTSMAPIKAACMVEMCYPYLRKDATVLDPFCGSGTLLIERAYKLPYKVACGVDVFSEAVRDAKKSFETAGITAQLITKDYFEYSEKGEFDEIITEFPDLFQKEKDYRKKFIRDFFEKSLEVSKHGSIWAVLSNEKGLMKQQIKAEKRVYLLEEIPFGGYRSLYILRKK